MWQEGWAKGAGRACSPPRDRWKLVLGKGREGLLLASARRTHLILDFPADFLEGLLL